MRLETVRQFLRQGGVRLTLRTMRLTQPYYRVLWLGAAARTGLLTRLAEGPLPLDALVRDWSLAPSAGDALESWLEMGVRLGELERNSRGYALRGFLARGLAQTRHDALAAIVEELATLHHRVVFETPELLRRGDRLTLADQDGVLVARSSRTVEPVVHEAIDDVLPASGPIDLLEVGAGSGTYMRYAAERNPSLTALGLELQGDVAALANRNLVEWGLGERASVDEGDVRARKPEARFDLVTLHNNIYYFPVDQRVELLRHLRGFLRPGGTLLLTTGCQGGSPFMQALDVWAATTEGCGRLPAVDEMQAQMRDAGFGEVRAKRMVPGESFHAFQGREPGGQQASA